MHCWNTCYFALTNLLCAKLMFFFTLCGLSTVCDLEITRFITNETVLELSIEEDRNSYLIENWRLNAQDSADALPMEEMRELGDLLGRRTFGRSCGNNSLKVIVEKETLTLSFFMERLQRFDPCQWEIFA